ncbi:hypothetical protein DJ524_07535, partial [Sulfolobus sp. D5]
RELEKQGKLKLSNAIEDDDKYWKLGMFYYNPNDDRVIIPKRFGSGYTFNFGNKKALILFISLLMLPIATILIVILI